MIPVIRISQEVRLPDTELWQFRFEIPSESSNRIYVIAQHKKRRHWGCSCPGWKRNRHCKHLTAVGIPGDEKPFEVNLIQD